MKMGGVCKEVADFYGLTQSRSARLWEAEGRKCHWCGRATILTRHTIPNQATEDHVIPRGRGGLDEESNIVSACLNCNARRCKEDNDGMREGKLLGTKWTRTYSSVSLRDVEIDRLAKELNIARERFKNEEQQAIHYRALYENVSLVGLLRCKVRRAALGLAAKLKPAEHASRKEANGNA